MRVAKNNNTSSTLTSLSEKDKPLIEQIVPILYGNDASSLSIGYAVIATNGTISLKNTTGVGISSSIIRFSFSYISI